MRKNPMCTQNHIQVDHEPFNKQARLALFVWLAAQLRIRTAVAVYRAFTSGTCGASKQGAPDLAAL